MAINKDNEEGNSIPSQITVTSWNVSFLENSMLIIYVECYIYMLYECFIYIYINRMLIYFIIYII